MAQTSTGTAINNAVKLDWHPSTHQLLLTVCNNDETAKVFSVPEMNHICTLSFGAAVNNGNKWGNVCVCV